MEGKRLTTIPLYSRLKKTRKKPAKISPPVGAGREPEVRVWWRRKTEARNLFPCGPA